MARSAAITAEVSLVKLACHECSGGIPAFSLVFMQPLRPPEPVDSAFQAAFPLCRVCFEREMTRRIEEART